MPLTAPVGNKSNFEPAPKGNHVARLYQIIHLGTLEGTWNGEPREYDKVRLVFELCNERRAFKEGEEEKPWSVGSEFTLSMNERANLRKFIEGLLGVSFHDDEAEGFDITTLLGQCCLLNVVHEPDKKGTGKVYANIQSASPLPKGMECPPLFNEPKFLDVNDLTEMEIEELPGSLRDKMKSSKEYEGRFGEPFKNTPVEDKPLEEGPFLDSKMPPEEEGPEEVEEEPTVDVD